jgi:hypothetical protein
MICAGVKQYDITPHRGVRLAGYPHFPRENEGFHDSLYVTAIYISNGVEEFAFAALDILFFSKKYATEVRKRINEACGIPEKNILINCSHTHSGPWAAGNPELEATAEGSTGDIDEEYISVLLDNIAKAVTEAKKCSFPATVGFGVGHIGAESGIGGNRRDKNGVVDDSLNILAVKNAQGQLKGVIANYSLHPTFLHEDSMLVSADYPAYLRYELTEKFPGAVVGFAQGTSGDQSSRYFRQGQSFDEAERVGRLMGKKAAEIIENMTYESDFTMAHASKEVEIRIRKYPPISELEEDVRVRTAYYEKLKAEGASYLDVQNANLRMLGAEDKLGYAICLRDGIRIDLYADENPAEVSAFRMGDHIICGYPGEVFVHYGLTVKEKSPAKSTFVFELADGCLPGYCITDDAYEEDGYEAGNCLLEPKFGDIIAGTALELIDEVMKN